MNIELYKAAIKSKDNQLFSDLSFISSAGDRWRLYLPMQSA